jgi:ferric-dicitrate binding protein FerR (iron transport regulator)
MVLMFPLSTVLADSNAAMLQANGAVKINDNTVNRSAAVFQGDRIATGKDSSAAITTVGTSILMAPNSQLTFEGKQVSLSAGGAHFNGAVAVRAGALTISPTAAKTRFEVRHEAGQVRITALEGNLSVSDGKQTTLLESGKSMASGKLPAVPQGNNSIAGGPGVIIALIMAAGVATGLAFTLTDNGVTSPSSP